MGIFGDRLKAMRVTRGIAQEQLSEMADITRTMIGRYETTDQLPAIDTLVRLADALGASTDYLLGRTDANDAYFTPECIPPKPARRMPKNPNELEAFVREIVEEAVKDMNKAP